MEVNKIIDIFEAMKNETNIEGMKRFAIHSEKIYGIKIPELRKMAKEIGKNHELALELWETEIHEGRTLAILIEDYNLITEEQAEAWVKDFASWDICDQTCMNLFRYIPWIEDKIYEWADRDEEFVKRTAYTLIATMCNQNLSWSDEKVLEFFPLIEKAVHDDRNFVKKAVNWAIREIGKRTEELNEKALEFSEMLLEKYPDSKSARWIAKDAIKDLNTEQTIRRYTSKEAKIKKYLEKMKK